MITSSALHLHRSSRYGRPGTQRSTVLFFLGCMVILQKVRTRQAYVRLLREWPDVSISEVICTDIRSPGHGSS